MKADDAVPEPPRAHEGVGAAASITTRRCQPFGHASYSLRRTTGVRAMGSPGPEDDLGVGSGPYGRRSLANAGPGPLPQGRRDRRPVDAERTLMVQLLGPGRPHNTNSCPVRGSGDVSNQPVESCLPWTAIRTTSRPREASAIQTPPLPGGGVGYSDPVGRIRADTRDGTRRLHAANRARHDPSQCGSCPKSGVGGN